MMTVSWSLPLQPAKSHAVWPCPQHLGWLSQTSAHRTSGRFGLEQQEIFYIIKVSVATLKKKFAFERWLETVTRPLLWQHTCFVLQPVSASRPIDNILEANQTRVTFLKAWSKEVTLSSGIWHHISVGCKAAISTGPSERPATCVPKTQEL